MTNTLQPQPQSSSPAGCAHLPGAAGLFDLAGIAACLCEVPAVVVRMGGPGAQGIGARLGIDPDCSNQQLLAALQEDRGGATWAAGDFEPDDRWSPSGLSSGGKALSFALALPIGAGPGAPQGELWVMDHVARKFSLRQQEGLQLLARQVPIHLREATQRSEPPDFGIELQLSRQIVASSPIGIGIYDRDGNCVIANEALAAHAGCTVAQASAQNIHRPASWQDSGIYAIAVRALASGGRASGVVRGSSSFGKALLLSVDFSVLQAPAAGHLLLMTQDLSRFREMEDARRELQDRFEMLFVNSMDGILLGRPDGSVTAANPAACEMLGLTEQQVIARGRGGVLDTSDPRLGRMTEERRLTGRTRGELRVLRGDGTLMEAEFSSVLYPDTEGRMLSSSIMRDITMRRRLEQQLKESLELLNRLAQRVPGVIYQYRLYPDGHSCFPFASEGIRSIYEVTPEEVREDATPVFSRVHPEDFAAVAASIEASARSLQPWHQEYRVVLPRQGTRWRLGDAKPERLEDGSVLWHGFITDITQRRRQEEQTHWLAYFDALTSLPNRRLLLDRIGQALAKARRSGLKGCLLFVDLDHFKRINDARGHAIGDSLLQQVAQRLVGVVRQQDTVARLGGDEFVILIGELGHEDDQVARAAVTVADKIRHALRAPYQIEGKDYTSQGSIGITLFPKGQETVDDLLREADTAMYRAKASGRDGIAFFEATMQAEVEEALALENDLKFAIERQQLALHVQGQYRPDGSLCGAEVLLRWHHPTRGLIPPAQFIPIAEDSGLILPIGEWVLEQAALGLHKLSLAGCAVTLSVNVSPRQFRHENFVERVRGILASTGTPARHLVLEVTEGLAILDPELATARMRELCALGLRFSLDDFGTEYAGLRHLKKLPLYELKIDRDFVAGLPEDPSDVGMVSAIVSIARVFDLRVVAEGVETAAQAEFLQQAGCHALQGYLLERPTPFDRWIAARLDGDRPSAAEPD